MIFIALLLHLLGHYVAIGFSKTRLKEIRSQLSWKQVFFELTGTISNFLFAFIIILTIGLTSYERYLLNENAIYGIKCNSLAKEIGFNDGDKIISVNNEKIERFSEIIPKIILQTGQTFVNIKRDGKEEKLEIPDSMKMELMKSNSEELLAPKLTPDSSSGIDAKPLVYSESHKSFIASIKTFGMAFRMANEIIFPQKHNGGFISITKVPSLKGWFFLIAIYSLFVGLINLLPLPGLDVGNTIIALIEKSRKRKFNRRIMRPIKIVFLIMLTALIIVKIFLM